MPFTSGSSTAAVRKSWELTTTPEQRERRLMPLKTRPPPDGSKSRAATIAYLLALSPEDRAEFAAQATVWPFAG
jgi:hypothetical protein